MTAPLPAAPAIDCGRCGLFAPTLAAWYGWNSVFGLTLIPLVIAFVLFMRR